MGQRFVCMRAVSAHGTLNWPYEQAWGSLVSVGGVVSFHAVIFSAILVEGAAGDVSQQKNFSMILVSGWAKTAGDAMGAMETEIGRSAAWRREDAVEFC